METKPPQSAESELPSNRARDATGESAGGKAGAGSLFAKGDIGVAPGTGTSGGGSTANAGLGSGSGTPGPPAQTVLGTNRVAKPIQSVRPVYPPMALKMSMEGDLTVKIIVDPEGNVSRAEIVRSSGADFN